MGTEAVVGVKRVKGRTAVNGSTRSGPCDCSSDICLDVCFLLSVAR
jgi:hypothetical protein